MSDQAQKPSPPPTQPASDPSSRAPDPQQASPARPSVTGRRAADLGGRRLIDLRPDDWLRFVTGRPEIHCLERLEGSFQWVGRESDVLLKVQDPEAGEFLVLIELQLRPDPRMALRLEAYAALAEDKFGLPVYGVAVIILPGGPAAADHYSSQVLGLEAHRDFRIVRLWEQDAREVATAERVGLLPLVPVMRGGDDPKLLAAVLDRLRSSPDLPGMERLLAYFAGLVLGREPMLQLMRWDMQTVTGMTFYEEILTKGIEQGIEQGREEGLEEGVARARRTATRFLLRSLTRRFGVDTAAVIAPLLEGLDLDALERLLDIAEEAAGLDAFSSAAAGLRAGTQTES